MPPSGLEQGWEGEGDVDVAAALAGCTLQPVIQYNSAVLALSEIPINTCVQLLDNELVCTEGASLRVVHTPGANQSQYSISPVACEQVTRPTTVCFTLRKKDLSSQALRSPVRIDYIADLFEGR